MNATRPHSDPDVQLLRRAARQMKFDPRGARHIHDAVIEAGFHCAAVSASSREKISSAPRK